MDTFTPGFDLDRWAPDKSDLTRWYYELAKYIKDHPIPGDDTIGRLIDEYLEAHPIGGDFYSADNPPPYPVTSVNGKTGNVTIDVPQDVTERIDGLETQTTQLTNAVGAINDSLPTKYSANNPPPYPVTSVNGYNGVVIVDSLNTPSGRALFTVGTNTKYPFIIIQGLDAYHLIGVDNEGIAHVRGSNNVDHLLYGDNYPPPYPVKKVNNQLGDVITHNYAIYTGTDQIIVLPPYSITTVQRDGINMSASSRGNFIEFAHFSETTPIVGVGCSLRSYSGGIPVCSVVCTTTNCNFNVLSNSAEPCTIHSFTISLFNPNATAINITMY